MRSACVVVELVHCCCLTEEDTTERGKGTEEVGLPCNRTLGHVDIGGSLDALGGGLLIGQVIVVAHDGGKVGGLCAWGELAKRVAGELCR
jgi:hypothetical protein